MSTSIEPWQNSQVGLLVTQAERLDTEITEMSDTYSGLMDLDLTLRSAALHFEIVNLLLRTMEDARVAGVHDKYNRIAKRSAAIGVQRLEEASSAEKAGDDVKTTEQYLRAEGLFHDLILAGGGVLLEGVEIDTFRRRRIANVVCSVLARFSPPDDEYQNLMSIDAFPAWLRTLVSKVIPSFIRSDGDSKLGIEAEEEFVLKTDVVRMPLSQAILYYEEELLPKLYTEVASNPGETVLGQRIQAIESRISEYRRMKFIPRSTPLILPQGYYTDGIAGYTAEGELLVSVPLDAEFASGTNLERMQYLVQSEIVRKLAGRGISKELDEEYLRLKSLSSGLKGNHRVPGFALDGPANFRKLKGAFPGLRVIDNQYQFKLLVEAARKGELKKVRKAIEQELSGGDGAKLLEKEI